MGVRRVFQVKVESHWDGKFGNFDDACSIGPGSGLAKVGWALEPRRGITVCCDQEYH